MALMAAAKAEGPEPMTRRRSHPSVGDSSLDQRAVCAPGAEHQGMVIESGDLLEHVQTGLFGPLQGCSAGGPGEDDDIRPDHIVEVAPADHGGIEPLNGSRLLNVERGPLGHGDS